MIGRRETIQLRLSRCTANVYAHRLLEDDPTEEEREEGNPVLLDGLRCLGYWYVSYRRVPLESCLRLLTVSRYRSDNLRQHPVR